MLSRVKASRDQRVVVEVDDVATWPPEVVKWIDDHAAELRGTAEYTCDLRIEDEDDLQQLVSAHFVRAYHCTRLLDHEREMIIEQGLRCLEPDLVAERIRRAYEVGVLTDAERAVFDAGHQFADPRWSSRVPHTEGQVCLIVPRQAFDNNASGCNPLLSIWGGEAISFPLEQQVARLHSLSRPSIVVAILDFLVGPTRRHQCFPSLANCMVGVRLGFQDVSSDVFYRAPVPSANIERILHPGDAAYDRHRKLPRR